MKKFAMISLITAGVMFALGLGLFIVGGVTGGIQLIADFSVNGAESLLRKFGGIPENLIPEEVKAEYNEAYPIVQGGSVNNMQICTRDEVTDVKICVMTGDLEIESVGGTDYFGVDWEGMGRFQYYVEDGTLYVMSAENFGDTTVYVPEDMVCESYTIAAAGSNVDADVIKAEEVSLYIGMSEVSIDTLEADSLTMEAGKCSVEIAKGNVGECTMTYDTGDIDYSGSISGNVVVTGSMGNLEFELWGDSDQYNYFIHSTMGSVDMPGYHVVGLTQNKTVDNNAGKDMTITSSMGSIEVNFMVE